MQLENYVNIIQNDFSLKLAGRLCLWRQQNQRDRRLDNDVTSFQKFRNNLQLL